MLDLQKLIDRVRREVNTRQDLAEHMVCVANRPAEIAAGKEAEELRQILGLLQRLRDYQPKPVEAPAGKIYTTIQTFYNPEPGIKAPRRPRGDAGGWVGCELGRALEDLFKDPTVLGEHFRYEIDRLLCNQMVSLRDFLLTEPKPRGYSPAPSD